MEQITNRGKDWEKLNSRWVYLTYFWFSAPFAFFYIGKKAKKKLWFFVGFAYLFVLGILFFGQDSIKQKIGSNFGGLLVTLLVVGIFLAYLFRKEYLIRLDMLEKANIKQMEEDNLRERAAKGLFQKGIPVHGPNTRQIDSLVEDQEKQSNSENIDNKPVDILPIDINLCSAENLTCLPGISLILAKKAINYRNENNGFESVDEFYRVIGLKPHFIAQIGNKIICETIAYNSKMAGSDQIGRKLDL